jgi:hypothetical protein
MSRKTEILDAEKKKDSIKDKIDVLEKDKDNLKLDAAKYYGRNLPKAFLKEWNKTKKIIGERYRKIWLKLQLGAIFHLCNAVKIVRRAQMSINKSDPDPIVSQYVSWVAGTDGMDADRSCINKVL